MASLSEYTGILGKRGASHLLKRCSYHFSKIRIDELATKTPQEAVDNLFIIPGHSLAEPIDYKTNQYWINQGIEPESGELNLKYWIIGWWMNEALQDTSIQHKLELFLHQNFAISAESVLSRELFDYMALIRYHSLISYKDLARDMALDNGMMRYLNGNSNTKINPNENFAREFFELFTIGKGPQVGLNDYTNYTEADILAAAKVFTGWINRSRPLGGDPNYINNNTGIQQADMRFHLHDSTDKQFSPSFDNTLIIGAIDQEDTNRELDDLVEMVFNQIETARNICRKLYRFFVSDRISEEVELDIIVPMAHILHTNDYNLAPALKTLLKSKHFYDQDDTNSEDEIIGGLVKSPLELLLQTVSFFNVAIPDPILSAREHYNFWYRSTAIFILLNSAGMTLYRPDSVAGYPAYYSEPAFTKNWFSGSTLIPRYKMPDILLTGRRILSSGTTGGVQLDIVLFVKNSGVITIPEDGITLVEDLTSYLFAETPTTERFNYFLEDIFLDGLSLINWQFEWQNYLTSYNDSSVKIPLERLFKALLSSQEFQVM